MIYYINFLEDFALSWSADKRYRVRRIMTTGSYAIIDNYGHVRFSSDTARGVLKNIEQEYATHKVKLTLAEEETTNKPRFKVGERVKVSNDLQAFGIEYKTHITSKMIGCAGNEATITSVWGSNVRYFINIDGIHQDWCWTEDMLDKIEEEPTLSVKCTKATSTFWTKGISYEVSIKSDGSHYVYDDDEDGWGGDSLDNLMKVINHNGNEFELLDKRPTEPEPEPEPETKPEPESEPESKHTLTDLEKIEAKITALSEESFQLFTKSEELSNKAIELQDESVALEEALYLIKQYLKEEI